jgi:predicted RNA-binding protein YlqC (UPF0109 family)
MKELLNYLTTNLVSDPDAIEITEGEREYHGSPEIVYQVRVAPDDMGKVIGRQGRTAKDMRTIVRAMATRSGDRVSIDVVD